MTTYAPETDTRRRRHVNPRLVAVIGLVIVAVALGALAWAVFRGGESPSRDEVLVDQVIAAWNTRDGEAIGRLYTRDAVFSSGLDDPMPIVGRQKIQELASGWWNTIVPLAEPTTLAEPSTGFRDLTRGVDPHYVLQPVLIHDDVVVGVFEVRGGKIATHMSFEPFEPARE